MLRPEKGLVEEKALLLKLLKKFKTQKGLASVCIQSTTSEMPPSQLTCTNKNINGKKHNYTTSTGSYTEPPFNH
jgi:hypothetical protein